MKSRPPAAMLRRSPLVEILEVRQLLDGSSKPVIHKTLTVVSVPAIRSPIIVGNSGGGTLGSFEMFDEDGYSAKVDWGDQTTSDGSISETSDGRVWTAATDSSAFLGDEPPKTEDSVYTVSGSHTYSVRNTYTIQVTVTDKKTGATLSLPSQSVRVVAPLQPLSLGFLPASGGGGADLKYQVTDLPLPDGMTVGFYWSDSNAPFTNSGVTTGSLSNGHATLNANGVNIIQAAAPEKIDGSIGTHELKLPGNFLAPPAGLGQVPRRQVRRRRQAPD